MSNTVNSSQAALFWVHALSPLHVGSGRGLGYIDLPIIREKVTNFPYIPGSAVKGVLADYHHATDKNRRANSMEAIAFGLQSAQANESNSGSLVFTDARLVCMPVRSMAGTFAWCTSPTLLRRFKRDMESLGMTCSLDIPEPPQEQGFHTQDSALVSETNIYLEDLDIIAMNNETASAWADFFAAKLFPQEEKERTAFVKRFIILADDVFNFLCETGTEVAAHIKIDPDKKTVAHGALWYEESLPAESILCGIVWCDRIYGSDYTPEKLMDRFANDIPMLQFGGKATTGKGIVRCLFDRKGGQK